MDDVTSRIPTTLGAGSLVEGIRAVLSDSIARGDLPAGTRLTEISLAEHFGCSTTPVREAIRKLEADGLVTIYPRRGAEVISLRLEEVEELYEARLLLECHAVRRAAERRPNAGELEGVRALAAAQRGHLHQGERQEHPLDAQLHTELAELGGNSVIAGLIGTTTRQIEAVQARAGARVLNAVSTIDAHEQIIEAIAHGDADRAEELMREHLEVAGQLVLDALKRSQTRPAS